MDENNRNLNQYENNTGFLKERFGRWTSVSDANEDAQASFMNASPTTPSDVDNEIARLICTARKSNKLYKMSLCKSRINGDYQTCNPKTPKTLCDVEEFFKTEAECCDSENLVSITYVNNEEQKQKTQPVKGYGCSTPHPFGPLAEDAFYFG